MLERCLRVPIRSSRRFHVSIDRTTMLRRAKKVVWLQMFKAANMLRQSRVRGSRERASSQPRQNRRKDKGRRGGGPIDHRINLIGASPLCSGRGPQNQTQDQSGSGHRPSFFVDVSFLPPQRPTSRNQRAMNQFPYRDHPQKVHSISIINCLRLQDPLSGNGSLTLSQRTLP